MDIGQVVLPHTLYHICCSVYVFAVVVVVVLVTIICSDVIHAFVLPIVIVVVFVAALCLVVEDLQNLSELRDARFTLVGICRITCVSESSAWSAKLVLV